MSRKPPRPTQAEREEVARLLPAPAERDLPGHRHQNLKDQLMREFQHSTAAATEPRRRYRRRLAWAAVPLVAGSLAVAVAMGGAPDQSSSTSQGRAVGSGPSGAGDRHTPASDLLGRIATVAASQPAPSVSDGQYVYVASTVADSVQSEEDPVMRLEKPHKRQVWLSVDGKRPGLLREHGQETSLGTQTSPSLSNPTYRYLESMPTDPGALLRKIYRETKGAGPGPDQEAFVTIGDLLREQMAPPKVSAALYKAAARIPGVTVVNDAVDAAGRHGVAVARVHGGERTEWIFNKSTLAFLGERSVMVKDTSQAKSGQVTASSAVVGRTVTDKPGQIPGSAN
ncbi:CU044_5270 family protein [Streptomyces sp. NPDC007984]|uniref:CU044_5270 family protein n=1 Tax=Streptomyces sp. NPDC007984 TaxID=3364801 RepID=UPI0036F0D307